MDNQHSIGIARGVALMLASESVNLNNYGDYHKRCQITPEEWRLLTSPALWLQSDRPVARMAFAKVLNGSMQLAGLTGDMLTAEYAATVISTIVAPANWRVCCDSEFVTSLSGEKLVNAMSDATAGRENILPDRLYAMVLYIAGNREQIMPRPEQTLDAIRDQAVEKARSEKTQGGKSK